MAGRPPTVKVWVADGATPEPSDWQLKWADTQTPIRSGYAGITGASVDGLGQAEVDYILIKADSLPEINVTFPGNRPGLNPPFFTGVTRKGTTSLSVNWFGGGTLQGAGTVTGSYTNIGATPPQTVPLTGAASPGSEHFYRVVR